MCLVTEKREPPTFFDREKRENLPPLTRRELWFQIQKLLQSRRQIVTEFQTKCVVHDEVTRITNPGDFRRCPSGGCHLLCGHEYACGHVCVRLCHPQQDHHTLKCTVDCYNTRSCAQGHTVMKLCGQSTPPCREQIKWECPQGHVSSGPCYKGKQSECKGCRKMRNIQQQNKAAGRERVPRRAWAGPAR